MISSAEKTTSTVREASFITGISVPAVNRAIDHNRIPTGIIKRKHTRLLTDTGVFILAVSKELKQRVPEETQKLLLTNVVKLIKRHRKRSFASLGKVSYAIGALTYVMELKPIAKQVEQNRRRLEKLMKTVVQDPEIQAEAPTFKGTRVLVYPVAQALERGVPEEELLEDYPSLTRDMLEAARIYAETKPRRGRPRADTRGLTPISERHYD